MGRLFTDEDGFDEDACLAMYDNNYDFYKLVLETFYKDVIRTIDGMRQTFSEHDEENYRIFVHGLKGAGGSAGAGHLVELATRSNDLIKEGKWDEAAALHEPILSELERIEVVIPARIDAFDKQ